MSESLLENVPLRKLATPREHRRQGRATTSKP
jgi:hypothetical protein